MSFVLQVMRNDLKHIIYACLEVAGGMYCLLGFCRGYIMFTSGCEYVVGNQRVQHGYTVLQGTASKLLYYQEN